VSLPVLLGVGLLGGLGAIARFLLDGSVATRAGRSFPWGTLAVNLTGAFCFGVLSGAVVGDDVARLAQTGFLGGYTTFSTWMLESHRLAEEGKARPGVANIVVSLLAGVAVAWVGQQIGELL
jgi:CrcB protein